MTFTLVAYTKHFVGFSTDEKPTDNIPDASTFKELDTGNKYYISHSVWYLDPNQGVAESWIRTSSYDTNRAMLSLLKDIKTILTEMSDVHINEGEDNVY